MFGNPETTTGGNALKFYSSVRMDVRKIETLSKGADEYIGNKVRVKIVKNKVAPPFRKVELDLYFDEGISYAGGILDGAIKYNFIEKTGSWYSYNGDKIGQGRDNALACLKQNPDLIAELESKLREAMFSKGVAEGTPSSDASMSADI